MLCSVVFRVFWGFFYQSLYFCYCPRPCGLGYAYSIESAIFAAPLCRLEQSKYTLFSPFGREKKGSLPLLVTAMLHHARVLAALLRGRVSSPLCTFKFAFTFK
ncbi:hypothetical protein ILYODFUR_031549 [Ilyodon furcidens]|uniref:Secreted protein n=1 Tax=Ilyodon furcidens TaxID=33524 RepID=A0ABV0TZC4_9TELE